jgi:hypothetical protein
VHVFRGVGLLEPRRAVEDQTYEERAARGARSQCLFRDVNERVKEINHAFGTVIVLGDWMCECADDECTERIALTHEEYEAVRADARRFAVAPSDDHVFHEIEDVVERMERYWVVEKSGKAGELAASVDPRAVGLRGSLVGGGESR